MSAPSFRRSSRRGTIQIQISSGGGRNVSSWQSVPPTVVTIRSYYKLIESRVIGDPLAPHVRHCLDEVNIKLDQVYCAWLIKWVVKREIIQLAELCLSRWWIKSGIWWYWISIWRYLLVLGQLKLVSSIKQKLSHPMTYDGNFSNQSLVLSPCQSRGLGDPRSYNVPRSFLEIQHTVATASQGHWQPMR